MSEEDEAFAGMIEGMTEDQKLYLGAQRAARKRIDELLSGLCENGRLAPVPQQRAYLTSCGLDDRHTDFLIELALTVDAAAVDADKRSIAQQLSFRDFDRDLERVMLDDLDRPFYRPAAHAALPLYPSAAGFMEDCYFDRAALEPLAKRASAWKYPLSGDIDRLLNALEAAGRQDLFQTLWAGIARASRDAFRAQRLGDDEMSRSASERYRAYALAAYADAIDWMERIGALDKMAVLIAERDAVRDNVQPAPGPIADERTIDTALFWELVSRARSGEDRTVGGQIAALGATLPGFKGTEIRRFASIYAQLMRRLYHWNAWALAYAARGGCSDDAFMAFRTWLILQGDPALIDAAVSDPAAAARVVPADPDLPDGTLMDIIGEAYFARSGKPLEFPLLAGDEPKGRAWAEDELEKRFPDLVRHYGA